MSRILLLGKDGQIGWELRRTLGPLGEVTALGRADADLTDLASLARLVREHQPNIIVNTAAYTAVDRAEEEEALATLVNGGAPGLLAEEARRLGALLVHYSTDYVFDGKASRPYVETDKAEPISAYGRSKLAGEAAIAAAGGRHLIFRTSWAYGARGQNFLRTMLRLGSERDTLRVVADQIGAPTWSRMIAEASALALARWQGQEGTYHMTAGCQTSWHGFAEAIFREAGEGRKPEVIAIPSTEYPLPARRPLWSVMDNSRLEKDFGLRLPAWRESLRLCLQA